MDECLIQCINGSCSSQCTLDTNIAMLAHQALDSVQVTPELSDVQLVDMIITRLWLHVEIWRACMTHSLLEASSVRPELRIEYPVEVLAQVAAAIRSLPNNGLRGNARAMVGLWIASADPRGTSCWQSWLAPTLCLTCRTLPLRLRVLTPLLMACCWGGRSRWWLRRY